MRYIKGKEVIARYRNGKPVVARFRNGMVVYGDVAAHKVLSYIESSGAEYLILPQKGGYDVNIKITFSLIDSSLDTSRIFGGFQVIADNTIRFESAYVKAAGRMRFGDGNGDPLYVDVTSEDMENNIHVLDYNNSTHDILWNDVNVGKYINTTVVSISNVCVMTRMNDVGTIDGVNNRARLRLRNIEIKDNTTGLTTMNYIPVEQTNGIVCMYDTISGSYLLNSGTGSFIGGEV